MLSKWSIWSAGQLLITGEIVSFKRISKVQFALFPVASVDVRVIVVLALIKVPAAGLWVNVGFGSQLSVTLINCL